MTGRVKAGGEKGLTMKHSLFTLAIALALSAGPALAQEFKAGDIVVEKPWARATPKGAEVGGGYLTIENKGDDARSPDRRNGGFRHGRNPSDDVQEWRHGDARG